LVSFWSPEAVEMVYVGTDVHLKGTPVAVADDTADLMSVAGGF
jgi:hypothetical protein